MNNNKDIKSNYYNEKFDDYDDFYRNYVNEISSEIYRSDIPVIDNDDYKLETTEEWINDRHNESGHCNKSSKNKNNKKTK